MPHALQHGPAVGDAVDYGGGRFEIKDMDGRRIDKGLATDIGASPRRLPTG